MPGPFILIFGPLLLATVALLLRRWILAATISGLVGIVMLTISLSAISLNSETALLFAERWTLFGRDLILTEQVKWTMLTIYLGMGLLFLLTLVSTESSVFVALGLAVLSPLAAALMVRPFIFGAVSILMAAAAVALIIQGDRAGSTLASWRHLAIFALAAPLLLVAGWMLEVDQSQFLNTIAVLFSLAFIILLIGFPFHIWVAPTSTESSSLVLVVVFGLVQLAILVFCIGLVRAYPVLLRNDQFSLFLRSSAIITLLLSSILALTASSVGSLMGYLLLLDIGATIYSFSLGNSAGLVLSLSLIVLRIFSLFLIAVAGAAGAWSVLDRGRFRRTGSECGSALGSRRFWNALAIFLLVFGALSLLGAPLTPGFAAKWNLVSMVSRQSTQGASVIVLSLAVGVCGLLRWIYRVWQTDKVDLIDSPGLPQSVKIAMSLALLVSLFLTISPQIADQLVINISVP